MQKSITGALQQIDSFANSATVNGVNLIAGATGNGVTSTQLQVLTDTTGNSFTVGGAGGNAINATSAGLGLANLSATSTAAQIQLGAITTSTAIVGNGATSTNLTLQNTAWTNGASNNGTAQNVAQKYVFVFDDGTASSANIDAYLNAVTAGSAGAAGTVFNDDATSSTDGISLTKDSNGTNTGNGSITDLGGGNTEFSLVQTADWPATPRSRPMSSWSTPRA